MKRHHLSLWLLSFLAVLSPVAPSWGQAKPATPARPAAVTIWCADPTEGLPPDLGRALGASRLPVLSGGALAAAGQSLLAARRAFLELRCGEALPALEAAEGRLLGEVMTADGKALLMQIESLMLVCADRLSDVGRASRAADRLLMTGLQPPTDVALVLRRYRPAPPAGPPPAPSRVESDPPGAQVIRDLLVVGQTPVDVSGGSPDVDTLDVELPGWRKIHRPLGAGERVSLGLRPEDRVPVLVDSVSARPLGSEVQAAALSLFGPALRAGQLPASRVVVVSPKARAGAPIAGEPLLARAYDVAARRWAGPVAEVAAGAPAQQAQQILAVAELRVAGAKGAPVVAAAAPRAAPKSTFGFKLPFARTKWYSWVIAGGVAALIAGLLVAERFGKDELTVHATYGPASP